jgi:hypothetical protein
LTELETVTEKSKRKAIEKRIQRLQVTNKPVERPRSTTPINVVNFEEYKPEKSPSLNSEKLSIKLSFFRGETHGEHNGLRVGGIKTRFGDCPGLIAVSTTKDFVLVKS